MGGRHFRDVKITSTYFLGRHFIGTCRISEVVLAANFVQVRSKFCLASRVKTYTVAHFVGKICCFGLSASSPMGSFQLDLSSR